MGFTGAKIVPIKSRAVTQGAPHLYTMGTRNTLRIALQTIVVFTLILGILLMVVPLKLNPNSGRPFQITNALPGTLQHICRHFPTRCLEPRSGTPTQAIRFVSEDLPGGVSGHATFASDGTCVIYLDPDAKGYSDEKTPSHEVQHCLRNDPKIDRKSVGGFFYYLAIEPIILPLELKIREWGANRW